MKYLLLSLLLLSCQGCTLLSLFGVSGNKPEVQPCSHESNVATIAAAKRAGCKRYKIDRDETLKTCTFH